MDDAQHETRNSSREEFKQKLREKLAGKLDQMADMLMDCEDENFFGQTEFALRDIVHELARESTEEALEARKKTPENPPG